MVTRETAPIGTAVTIIYSTQHSRDFSGRVGTVNSWDSAFASVRFSTGSPIWFNSVDVELHDPDGTGDALSRIRG